MRRYSYSSGGKSDGTGCAIFLIMIICFPALGIFFGLANWVVEHILLILIGLLIIWILRMAIKEERKEKEMERQEERD